MTTNQCIHLPEDLVLFKSDVDVNKLRQEHARKQYAVGVLFKLNVQYTCLTCMKTVQVEHELRRTK